MSPVFKSIFLTYQRILLEGRCHSQLYKPMLSALKLFLKDAVTSRGHKVAALPLPCVWGNLILYERKRFPGWSIRMELAMRNSH